MINSGKVHDIPKGISEKQLLKTSCCLVVDRHCSWGTTKGMGTLRMRMYAEAVVACWAKLQFAMPIGVAQKGRRRW